MADLENGPHWTDIEDDVQPEDPEEDSELENWLWYPEDQS